MRVMDGCQFHQLHGGRYEILIWAAYQGELTLTLRYGWDAMRTIRTLNVREPGWLAKRRGMTLDKAVDEAINQLVSIADELEAERTRMEAAALVAGQRLAARLEESRPKGDGRAKSHGARVLGGDGLRGRSDKGSLVRGQERG